MHTRLTPRFPRHPSLLPLTSHDEPKEGTAQGAGLQVGGTVDATCWWLYILELQLKPPVVGLMPV